MAESTGGMVIKYGLLGLAGWWAYNRFFATSTAPAPATSSGTGAGSPPASASPALTPSATPPPAYSGPSLAQLYANLLAATQAAIGSDPAVTCAGLASSLAGVGAVETNAPRSTSTAGCSMPQATYDVFNWYLMNRSNAPAALSAPLDPPDHSTVITAAQYWAWVSPLLQKQIVGLSGMGAWGMGHIGAIRQIVRTA